MLKEMLKEIVNDAIVYIYNFKTGLDVYENCTIFEKETSFIKNTYKVIAKLPNGQEISISEKPNKTLAFSNGYMFTFWVITSDSLENRKLFYQDISDYCDSMIAWYKKSISSYQDKKSDAHRFLLEQDFNNETL